MYTLLKGNYLPATVLHVEHEAALWSRPALLGCRVEGLGFRV